MSDDDYLCVKEITKIIPITLTATYQENGITGILNVLDSWKCRYIKQLQGVVVSYRNATLLSENACFTRDYPTVRCNVKATFKLFFPTIGKIVKGKVNRISHDYIGCLVHDCINAAIHRTHNEYDNISNFISLDQIILFEITYVGYKSKIIRVIGKITQECINLMKNMYPSTEETNAVHQNIFTSAQKSSGKTDSEEHETNDRDFRNENMSESLLDNENLFDGSFNCMRSGSSTKKKKKSKKFKSEQSHHFETFGTENGELSSRTFIEDLNKSHDSQKKKNKKSIVQTGYSSFVSSDSTFDCPEFRGLENSNVASSSSLLNESDRRISQDKFSATEKRTNFKEFNSSYDKDINPIHTSLSQDETSIETKDFDNLIESLASYDPSVGSEMFNKVLLNDKCSNSSKKAKKRKHDSSDEGGLPKKKKKVEKKETSLVKSSNKHKIKKKSKVKSEKDSKKGKKKSKNRVISSKKKLPKLKKKKREKGEKLKKKLKKKSKNKLKDVP